MSKQLTIRMCSKYSELTQKLNNPKVHIKDTLGLNKLLDIITAGGKDKIQVISDFDRTLTRTNEEKNTHVSSLELLGYCPSVTSKYLDAEKEFMCSSISIELNQSSSDTEKSTLQNQLLGNIGEALKGERVTCEELLETAKKVGPLLREGTHELFTELKEANIPILVFSAGYGDSIEAIFKHFDVLYPNIKIISNFFHFDNGQIQGFKNANFINPRNKRDLASKDLEYIKSISDRENVILLGDSLGDACMADGIPGIKHILKIGFKCKRDNISTSDYLKVFDIVIEDRRSVDVVQAIFKHILK